MMYAKDVLQFHNWNWSEFFELIQWFYVVFTFREIIIFLQQNCCFNGRPLISCNRFSFHKNQKLYCIRYSYWFYFHGKNQNREYIYWRKIICNTFPIRSAYWWTVPPVAAVQIGAVHIDPGVPGVQPAFNDFGGMSFDHNNPGRVSWKA